MEHLSDQGILGVLGWAYGQNQKVDGLTAFGYGAMVGCHEHQALEVLRSIAKLL